jgi:transposase InsO family protein
MSLPYDSRLNLSSGFGSKWCSKYSLTISSVNWPTVAQKYPRAQKCWPQYRFLIFGYSSKSLIDVRPLIRLIISLGAIPKQIQVDNGSEFVSKALDKWAYEKKVTLDFSRPGKPTDNPFIESFNGRFRDECLNLH